MLVVLQIPAAARPVFRRLLDAGYECYLVGGSVRDLLLQRSVGDLDFTTNAHPDALLRLFKGSHYPNRFGTVLVRAGGTQHEVTTYRGEGRYSDHRHPDEIAFVDRIEDDLQRRDFTINAMALDAEARLVDPFGGQEDLHRRLIRAVGDPAERLAEDPLRMMRAARLATQLLFTIELRTWDAIVANARLLAMISRERLRDELLKILASDHPVTGIDLLDHLQLLDAVLPNLAALRRINRPASACDDTYRHALQTLRFCRGAARLRLAALLHVLDEQQDEVAGQAAGPSTLLHELERLRLSNADAAYVRRLVTALPSVPPDLPADARSARRLLSAHTTLLPDLFSLVEAHRRAAAGPRGAGRLAQLRTLRHLAERARRERQPLTIGDLALKGDDLIRALGMTPGPRIGLLLRLLLERVLEDPALNDRQQLLALARIL